MRNPRTVALIAVLLLLGSAWTRPAEANDFNTAGVGSTITGGFLTGAGAGMVVTYAEHQLRYGDEGAVLLGMTIPTLLIPGIQTLTMGIVENQIGPTLGLDDRQLVLWERATTGAAIAMPCIVLGSLTGGIGLVLRTVWKVFWGYSDYPSYLGPATGAAMLIGGIIAAYDADNAIIGLGGEVPSVRDAPGALLLSAGITLLAMGNGLLMSWSPAIFMNNGSDIGPGMSSVMVSVIFQTVGAVIAVSGTIRARKYTWDDPDANPEEEPKKTPTDHRGRELAFRFDGIVPMADPQTEARGFVLCGRF